ncbi:ABC transporter transmembrane domain-containing protein [Solimonas variicoloris]|uniref:ABC transporter transmembrane domain-containing protein n=1 Tax=Solimonas variicoloris TaxID=254408 RepID=UPI00037C8E95|nr:ABC transporter transmembrane domain-containing protein [Solimonas variicoloris]
MSAADADPASGVATALEDAAASASRRRLGALRGLLPFLRPYRRRLFAAFALLCVSSATFLVVPLAFRGLIDHGFVGGGAIGGHFLGLFGIAVLWALATAGRFYQVSWIGERVTADLRSAVYRRMLEQSPQYFETTQTGEVLSRLTGDTTLVQTVVGSSLSMGLRSAFQFAGGLVMLALTSAKLFAITLVLLAAVIVPLIWAGRRVRKLSRESQDRIADSSAVAGEVLNAIPTVQAYTNEPYERQRFDAAVERSFASAIRRTRMRALLTGGIIAGVFGSIVFVLWLGAQAVMSGQMTAGALASFVMYAAITAGGVGVLAEVWGDVMRAAGATERLMELLSARPTIAAPPQPQPLPATQRAHVRFEHVGFRYPSRPQTPALADFDLDVREGETVALVGPSGAGKTTAFQLLQRFYDVGEGGIRFNGVDLRELDPRVLRAQIGVVPQEAVVFSANALENIRYGRPGASDEDVIAAARTALADEFIARLPEGYKTFVGERGVRLSGGQRQRLAIARAILKNPPLLLLDEATSALDAESEALVQRGLEAAMQGRTTLVIAHRLATVQRADRIVVLEHGRIVETGTPAELARSGGLYARLASLQLVA